jgi:type I restriction enzyme S subunit
MKYSSYLPSIIRWNHVYPSHWDCEKAKRFFANPKCLNKNNVETNILSLTLGGVIRNNRTRPIGLSPSDYATYQIFEPNELVFKLIDLENVSTSRVGLVPERGIMSSAYIRLSPRLDLNMRYFYYQYFDWYKRLIFNGLGEGVRQTLSGKDLINLEILLPPREEQDQIVRYLDWQVSKTNKLISALKKQIALLKELKQAVINEAVTKGLDPNVPMKDSGIEWIGQIPQEWVVNRLKTQVSLSTSKKNRDNEFYIGMENIQSWTGKYVSTTEIDSEGTCGIFENNNILFGKLRPYLAKVYLTENNGVCSSEFLVLKNFNGILRYLFYVLLSYKFIDLVNSSTYGAKMPRANWDFIGNCSIPIPSLEEQNKIASYLDDKCYKIENLKAKIQNEIELLYEYRTRLISDVVTGKVDVRDIEIPEYEADSDDFNDNEIDDNLVFDEEDGETEVE